VLISDPSVSRFHAEFQFNGKEWELANLGKNGTLVFGRAITRSRIDEQTLFRLGTAGPLLRFQRSDVRLTASTRLRVLWLLRSRSRSTNARRTSRCGRLFSQSIFSISRVFPQSCESAARNRADGTRLGPTLPAIRRQRANQSEVPLGVSGGLVAVVPGKLAIGVYSPRVDPCGNSVRGVKVCQELSRQFGLHLFESSSHGRSLFDP